MVKYQAKILGFVAKDAPWVLRHEFRLKAISDTQAIERCKAIAERIGKENGLMTEIQFIKKFGSGSRIYP